MVHAVMKGLQLLHVHVLERKAAACEILLP